MRGRYEGMRNVVRFNWPKYGLGLVVLLAFIIASVLTSNTISIILALGSVLAALALLLPLLASHFIYDRSHLYTLPWLDHLPPTWTGHALNINAGFDETSAAIRQRLSRATLVVADFYDPKRHTEPSIERARRTYTTYPGTLTVATGALPLADASMDLVLGFLALHEVRDPQERVRLLRDIHRILKPDGRLIITEHLRDLPNFFAFNFGFFHFHSHDQWADAFARAGFAVDSTQKTTAFITTFVLEPR